MIQLISKTKASDIVGNYYELLTKTGYVKEGSVRKIAAYLFLIDLVIYMHHFINDEDYKKIDKALAKLFSGGSCLLPYPVFCTRRATLGAADYMGPLVVRITEDEITRVTEDDKLRIV